MGVLRRLVLTVAVWILLIFVALQIASHFFLAPVIERQAKRIFQTPVRVEKAWIDFLTGSIWMKGVRIPWVSGFENADFVSIRRLSIDISLLSLLASEFVIQKIRLDEPEIVLKTNAAGQWNGQVMAERAGRRIRKIFGDQWKWMRWVVRYELEKFSIRNGSIQVIDTRFPDAAWTLKPVSFSVTRILFPPDPEEALPAAVYLNATVEGAKPGKILVLGRVNFFAPKKSFDVMGSMKDLALPEYNYFLGDFPLRFSDGIGQIKIKALCHEDQADFSYQASIEKLRFVPPEEKLQMPSLTARAFNLPPETVLYFFNELRDQTKPFELSFRLTGELTDPNFNIARKMRSEIDKTIYERVTQRMEAMAEETKQIAQGVLEKLSQ